MQSSFDWLLGEHGLPRERRRSARYPAVENGRDRRSAAR
jgi:hypothetical protein